MFLIFQVATVFVVSVAMAMALAHALELPGKMRLGRENYIAVQTIYYPGFTYGGFSEGLGMIATLVLLFLTPKESPGFWWTLAGLVALLGMHAVYWIVTHPVNKFWMKDQHLKGFGAGFFSLDPLKRGAGVEQSNDDWTRFRNQWEYSHVLRAALSAIALIALIIAVAI
jgi:hypothetical protein